MTLSEDQILLNDMVHRWLDAKYGFDTRNAIMREGGYSPAIWAEMAEMGWLGIPFGEEYGGFGGGAAELVLLATNFGRRLVLEPYLSSVVLAGGLIEIAASQEHRQRLLPEIIAGNLRVALAHSEGRHFEVNPGSTLAEASGNSWRLSGEKKVVLDATGADMFIVSALSADQRPQLFLVEAAAVPVDARTPYRLVDGRPAADIVFDKTDAVLLHDADFDVATALGTVFERAALYVAAEMTGAMHPLCDAALSYIHQRQQFGQKLVQNQVIQHSAVDVRISLESARALTALAARAISDGDPQAPRLISAAKAEVGRLATFVGQRSIQMHGGIGMTNELDVGHYYKRILADETLFGSSTYHWLQLARA